MCVSYDLMFDPPSPLSDSKRIQSFRKACKILRPPKPRSKPEAYYPDVARVFGYWESKPSNESLSLEQLRLKLSLLLLVDGVWRVGDLLACYRERFSSSGDSLQGDLFWPKEAKVSGFVPVQLHRAGSPKTDTVACFDVWCRRTRTLAERAKVWVVSPAGKLCLTPLFLTLGTESRQITSQRLSNLIASFIHGCLRWHMRWRTHDIRGASASKLENLGVARSVVLRRGRWASEKNYLKYYFIPCELVRPESHGRMSLEALLRAVCPQR